MATINISLPTTMYQDAKAILRVRGYASISELIRQALRDVLYPKITENGFTPEFEEEVLRAEKSPRKHDIVLSTDKEIKDYFLKLKVPKKKSV
jgi:Arc/MetJ-type ribon-helix-helix transcriptional regulator